MGVGCVRVRVRVRTCFRAAQGQAHDCSPGRRARLFLSPTCSLCLPSSVRLSSFFLSIRALADSECLSIPCSSHPKTTASPSPLCEALGYAQPGYLAESPRRSYRYKVQLGLEDGDLLRWAVALLALRWLSGWSLASLAVSGNAEGPGRSRNWELGSPLYPPCFGQPCWPELWAGGLPTLCVCVGGGSQEPSSGSCFSPSPSGPSGTSLGRTAFLHRDSRGRSLWINKS